MNETVKKRVLTTGDLARRWGYANSTSILNKIKRGEPMPEHLHRRERYGNFRFDKKVVEAFEQKYQIKAFK